ncbi:MAG TPA: mechanosensitive ion channel domain-containing protein [Candidatus Methylomirabilis sp.]|nr:mechanosensitive ion channel domain-containing protein [Candidatus Methylomirabilis sp.]
MSVTSLAWSLAILALLAPIPAVGAADQATPAPKSAPASPAPAAIPVGEVATQAAGVSALLRSITAQTAPSTEIQTVLVRLPEVSRQIGLELELTAEILQVHPALAVIATQQKVWQERQLQLTRWMNLLTARATQFQESLNRLADLRATWRQTATAAETANAPEAISAQIVVVLAAIAGAETSVQAARATLLDLQGRLGQEVARCGAVLAKIGEIQQRAMGGILVRDTLPIWDGEQWVDARSALPARIHKAATSRWESLVEYTHDASKGMPWHVGTFVVLMGFFCAMRRRVRQWAAAGENVSRVMVFDRPYAAALLLPLLYASSPYSALPSTLKQFFELLGLVPVFRLIRPVIDPRVLSGLYVLPLLFGLDIIRQDYSGAPGLEQAILTLEMLAGMVTLGYALTWGRLRGSSALAAETKEQHALRLGAFLVLLTLSVGLVSEVLGYMRLARLLASGVLGSGALALTLHAWVRVLAGVAAFDLRVWPLRLLRMVWHHRELLERRTYNVLCWLAIIGWTFRTLDYVGLFHPARSLGTTVLAARLQVGSIGISLSDVLVFVVMIWLAYLLSAFIRFVLQEDVYPHLHLTRGLPYAVSSLLNYVIMALGFLLGLGALGLDLTKVTVLAGALGVGIGFGLQGVVNNFISGLILLFERPMHVGDTVEVADLSGEVSRIGIRASTVRTGGGAEIIVPNSQFVTERLTNWTLSDRLRRIELPVGVNYGASPKDVIALLEAVARAHPDVLQNPTPRAYFTGFGESSINFELHAWTGKFGQWFQIRSELATAVYDSACTAGMTFPFPQREVRILHDVETGPAALPQPPHDRGRAETRAGRDEAPGELGRGGTDCPRNQY